MHIKGVCNCNELNQYLFFYRLDTFLYHLAYISLIKTILKKGNFSFIFDFEQIDVQQNAICLYVIIYMLSIAFHTYRKI